MTLFEMQEQLADLDRTIASERANAIQMARDPGAKMDDIRAAQMRVDDLVERRGILAKEESRIAAASKERAKGSGKGGEMSFRDAVGMYFRAIATGANLRDLPAMAYEQLGEIPANSADQGNGSVLLPTKLADRLILDPAVNNPLRKRMTVTNVPGLALPKLNFTIDDDDFVDKAGATAKELKANASDIVFDRKKMLLSCDVSTTLLLTSPLNIEHAVTSGLDNAMITAELKRIFAASPKAGQEHMSFYAKDSAASAYVVKGVEGSDAVSAIVNALGDLEEIYQANASIVMRRMDYYRMILALTNSSEALFSEKPAQILGYPVDFCEYATEPVVGDFSYLHINYDSAPRLDNGKEVKRDMTTITETATYDIKRRMNAAFRRATVAAGE